MMLLMRRRLHTAATPAVYSGHVGHDRTIVVVVAIIATVVVVVVVTVGGRHDLQRHLRVLIDRARGDSGTCR